MMSVCQYQNLLMAYGWAFHPQKQGIYDSLIKKLNMLVEVKLWEQVSRGSESKGWTKDKRGALTVSSLYDW